MHEPAIVKIYGRDVELEPLGPDEEVVDVVVVVKTRHAGGDGSTVAVAHRPGASEPPRMSSDLRYLMDLGLTQADIADRSGRTETAIRREIEGHATGTRGR